MTQVLRTRAIVFIFSLVVMATVTANSAAAQQDPVPPTPASLDAARPSVEGGSFGMGLQSSWIPATAFTGRAANVAALAFNEFHYYSNPGSATPQRYYASLELPNGAKATNVVCQIYDASGTNDVTIGWEKTNASLILGGVPTVVATRTGSFAGAVGYAFAQFDIVNDTDRLVQYFIGASSFRYYLYADIASDTRLRGCYVIWGRTVSPAPATARFADVPVGNPYHPFIEALVAAGVTGGCTVSNYCPNLPITRAEMAVFLAVLLGLHWPG